MPDILDNAIDAIARGAIDSQCQNMAEGFVKEGVLNAADVPAMTTGLKLLVGVFLGTLAKGQSH